MPSQPSLTQDEFSRGLQHAEASAMDEPGPTVRDHRSCLVTNVNSRAGTAA